MRATVNATIVDTILIRGNEIFNTLISSLWYEASAASSSATQHAMSREEAKWKYLNTDQKLSLFSLTLDCLFL